MKLTNEERNLFSVAYKNKVGARRSSWRVMKSIEQRNKVSDDDRRHQLTKDYRRKIEKELKDICYEVGLCQLKYPTEQEYFTKNF